LRYNSGLTSRKSLLTAFLLILVFAGIALRFVRLGGNSLWTDEMLTIRSALVNQPMDAAAIFGDVQGPLISVMMHFWAGVSTAEAFLRFPFAVAGALSVGALFMLSKLISGRWVGLNTVLFASLSPILIWYSQEVRGYAFVMLFSILMTYYLLRWAVSRTNRHLFLYALFLLAALLSNLTAVFVPIAHFIYLAASPSKRRLLGGWIVAVLVVLLFFSPWVRSILLLTHVDRMIGADTGEQIHAGGGLSVFAVPYLFFTYSVGYSLGPPAGAIRTEGLRAVSENLHWILAALVIFAVPAVVGVRKLAQEKIEMLFLLLVWLLVPIAAVSALALRNVRPFTPRYTLVSVAPYALIVGRGLGAVTKSKWWFLTVVFAALLGASLYNYFLVPAYGKDDARAVAQTIRENFNPGDAVVALFASRPLAHYLGDFARVETFGAGDMESPETVAARCAGIADTSNRVWLSLCREWVADPKGLVHGWFEGNMTLIRSLEFPGMRLYLYGKERG
jgi:uncharacterized membrane protein